MVEHPSYVFCKLYRLVRAHRSHRWGHRFESCCDHHKPLKTLCFRGLSLCREWTPQEFFPAFRFSSPKRFSATRRTIIWTHRSFIFSLLTKRVFILSTKLDVDGMPVRCVQLACVRCGRYDCKSRPPNEKGANRAPMFYMFTLHTLSFNRFWV